MYIFKALLYSSALLVVACGGSQPPPNSEQIEAIFNAKSESFESIRTYLGEDHETGYEYVIRIERKSDDISKERHEEYLKILNGIPAEKASLYEKVTYVTIFTSGFVGGGCLTHIIHNPDQKPKRPSWADHYNLVVLGNDWYGETRCGG